MASQPVIDTATAEAPANQNQAPAAPVDMYPDDKPREAVEAEPADVAAQEPADDDAALAEQIEQEAAEAEKPKVAPPNSWSDEDKAVFGKLDPEAQAVISRREMERDRQIYAKGQETRKVEAEAREAVLKINSNYAMQVNALLGASEAPARPDPRLLSGQEEHRALFYQQEADFRTWETQQQQLQSYLGQIQSHAQALEAQHMEAQRAEDEQLLSTELGETWSEPSTRQKFLNDLEPIGEELGYSRELMRQANATDILALHKANTWKAKAAKWDDLQKRKMTDVRANKHTPPPRVSQPGVAGVPASGISAKDIKATLYPDDARR